MNKHPVIDKWAQKKYNRPVGTEFLIKQETKSGGYCETCWYEYEAIVIYEVVNGSLVEIDEMDIDVPTLINEIFDSIEL